MASPSENEPRGDPPAVEQWATVRPSEASSSGAAELSATARPSEASPSGAAAEATAAACPPEMFSSPGDWLPDAAETKTQKKPAAACPRERSRSPPRGRMTLRDLLPEAAKTKMKNRLLPGVSIFDREMDVTNMMERSQLIVAQAGALQMLNEVHADMNEVQMPTPILHNTTRFSSLIDAIPWGASSGVLSLYEANCLRALNRHANAAKHIFQV